MQNIRGGRKRRGSLGNADGRCGIACGWVVGLSVMVCVVAVVVVVVVVVVPQ